MVIVMSRDDYLYVGLMAVNSGQSRNVPRTVF